MLETQFTNPNVCACVLVAAKYLTTTQSPCVGFFRQRTISKLLIRQFDFNETSGVDSRQQYKLSVKNGKIASYGFVIQFWIMSQFEYNLPFSTLLFVCGSYWLPVNCLQTKFLNIPQYKEVCIQKVFNNGNSLPSTKIFDNLKSFAPNTNIWQEK